MDDKISLLVDLVAWSQTPLLIRLECVYTDPASGRTATVPITSLPTAFAAQTRESEFINFESNISNEIHDGDWSPLDSKSTTVALHLVCINIPRSQDEDIFITNPSMPLPRE